ncbi:MAG: hypothetical protein WBH60_08170 [Fervidobacterium sp.]
MKYLDENCGTREVKQTYVGGLLRKYKKHAKHARKRPKNHEVSERNKY